MDPRAVHRPSMISGMRRAVLQPTIPPSQIPLIICAYYLPLQLFREANGRFRAVPAGDKLLASTPAWSHEDLFRVGSTRRKIKFVGCLDVDFEIAPHEEGDVVRVCAEFFCTPVFITTDADRITFDAFCKRSLWPAFHGIVHPNGTFAQCESTSFEQDPGAWQACMNINRDIATTLARAYEAGDHIWLQDYQVAFVPHFLQRILRLTPPPIGLFFHVPFPSPDAFRILSHRAELLKSMLQANLIGFHLYEHAKYFLSACKSILGISSPAMVQGQFGIEYNGRRIAITCSQLTVDASRIEKLLAHTIVTDQIIAYRQTYPGKLLFAGCDVLDPFHGLISKLLAFDMFLQQSPTQQSRVVLLQYGVLTKFLGTLQYFEQVKSLIEKINAKYPEPVIVFRLTDRNLTCAERLALWRVAEVYISTVLKEGLNICAFEYIVAHKNATGAAILSECAASSRLLHGALVINPWDLPQVAKAMQTAVLMPSKEREFRRDCDLVTIGSHSPVRWAYCIVSDIAKAAAIVKAGTHFLPESPVVLQLLQEEKFLDMYRKCSRRVFFFDYYRTLAPDVSSDFGIVWPDVPVSVLSSLEQLCRDKRNSVFVVSGCNCELLSDKFGSVPGLGLVAEHGYFLRWAYLGHSARMDKPWELYGDVFRVNAACGKWREKAQSIMQIYVDRTNGSALEMRRSSILFRYAKSDPEYGLLQAMDLRQQLELQLENWPLSIIQGKDYIEVRPEGLGKGKIVGQILTKLQKDSDTPIDFVLAMGDDVADELMFEAVEDLSKAFKIPTVITCTVGHKATQAKYFLEDQLQVVSLLNGIRIALTKSNLNYSVSDMQTMLGRHMHHIPQISFTSKPPSIGEAVGSNVSRKNSSKTIRSGLLPVLEEDNNTPDLLSNVSPRTRRQWKRYVFMFLLLIYGVQNYHKCLRLHWKKWSFFTLAMGIIYIKSNAAAEDDEEDDKEVLLLSSVESSCSKRFTMAKAGCLTCCVGFSFVGMVFLTILAIILSCQPQYVHGFHYKKKPNAKNSCMYAAILYGVVFAAAYYFLHKHNEAIKMKYGVVMTKDECELLKTDECDGELKEMKVGSSMISVLKSHMMNAKVMHSEEMASLVKSDEASSPRKSKIRKDD
ncbi:alpha,alpha-trehalose-phosphate synthase, UDP-forming [Thraustotheca clavata]|uniref:Alpha,alpha-trehalose-phosphate synthase, UDP-forming n=1 Tax=Thraustotheca clavata TaxID=74557 RepID=A0A1V9YXM7_9STRA|nr:alpha,alpha-trehalose-phosphate synthase, UDP-forming [Thraustotheca clavata]